MQKLIRHLLSVIIGIVCLSSCVTSRKVNYWQEPDRQIPSYTDTLSYEDYLLRKGDRLYIYVHSIDERITKLFNSGNTNIRSYVRSGTNAGTTDLYSYVVDDAENIIFPTVGAMPVLGKTTREVKHELEDLLKGQIKTLDGLSTISVDVQVIQRYFSVIGANNSGRFIIPKEKITIFEALAMAGDIADFGDRSCIKLVRETSDSTIVKTFDVRSKDIINSEYYYIEPNDVIYIRKIAGNSFGINSAAATVSVVATTFSFGVLIYSFVDRYIVKQIVKGKSTSASQ